MTGDGDVLTKRRKLNPPMDCEISWIDHQGLMKHMFTLYHLVNALINLRDTAREDLENRARLNRLFQPLTAVLASHAGDLAALGNGDVDLSGLFDMLATETIQCLRVLYEIEFFVKLRDTHRMIPNTISYNADPQDLLKANRVKNYLAHPAFITVCLKMFNMYEVPAKTHKFSPEFVDTVILDLEALAHDLPIPSFVICPDYHNRIRAVFAPPKRTDLNLHFALPGSFPDAPEPQLQDDPPPEEDLAHPPPTPLPDIERPKMAKTDHVRGTLLEKRIARITPEEYRAAFYHESAAYLAIKETYITDFDTKQPPKGLRAKSHGSILRNPRKHPSRKTPKRLRMMRQPRHVRFTDNTLSPQPRTHEGLDVPILLEPEAMEVEPYQAQQQDVPAQHLAAADVDMPDSPPIDNQATKNLEMSGVSQPEDHYAHKDAVYEIMPPDQHGAQRYLMSGALHPDILGAEEPEMAGILQPAMEPKRLGARPSELHEAAQPAMEVAQEPEMQEAMKPQIIDAAVQLEMHQLNRPKMVDAAVQLEAGGPIQPKIVDAAVQVPDLEHRQSILSLAKQSGIDTFEADHLAERQLQDEHEAHQLQQEMVSEENEDRWRLRRPTARLLFRDAHPPPLGEEHIPSPYRTTPFKDRRPEPRSPSLISRDIPETQIEKDAKDRILNVEELAEYSTARGRSRKFPGGREGIDHIARINQLLKEPSEKPLAISESTKAEIALEKELAAQKAAEEARRAAEEARRATEERAQRELEARLATSGGLRLSRQDFVTPVSDEWEEKALDTLNAPASRILAKTREGVELRRHDFAKVVGETEWLNDEIVNGSLNWLDFAINSAAGIKDPKKQTRKSLILSSLAFKKLQDEGGKNTQRMLRRYGVDSNNLLDIDTIMVPICEHSHWTLLVVRPTKRTVSHMDSLNPRGSNEHMDLGLAWMSNVLGDKFNGDEWKKIRHQAPRQTNGWDCGVHTITNAMCLALGLFPLETYGAKDMPTQRIRIASMLLNNGFNGEFDLRHY